MPQSDVEHWQRKAARARDAAAKMLGENARSIMLDIADYYEQRAREAGRPKCAARLTASWRPMARPRDCTELGV